MKVKLIILLNIFISANADVYLQDFVKGNNLLAANFYNEIAKTNQENILISPLSTEIIFALARSGARGGTAEEIQTALHLPITSENTESAIKTLLPLLKGDANYALHTANKIYVKNDFELKKEFINNAINNYYSEVENIDFTIKEQAAKNMNKWVEDQTNNKIHDLISPSDLDESTIAILINALYLKGRWENPFSNYSTQSKKFYVTSQNSIDVDMMHSYDKVYKYYEDKELDANFVELSFKGENLSMVIVLPNQKDGISSLETQMNNVFAERNFSYQLLNLQIPKFRIEDKIDLKEILIKLGVKKAFDKNEADFSGITDLKIHINQAMQKTFMEVNEIGVEAAAASFIEYIYASALLDTPKNFIADHPFLFYIKFGNTILFTGRVSNPTQK